MFTLLTRMCSLCLNKDRNLESMFNKDRNKITIQEKLYFCVSEMANPEEELPTLICTICYGHLNAFYSFKKMCLESKKKLHELIREEKQNPSSTNPESVFLKSNSSEITSNSNNNKPLRPDISNHDSASNDSDDSYFEEQDSFENISNIIDFKKEPDDSIQNTSEQNIENKTEGKKTYKCADCGKEFINKGSLTNHVQTHDPNRARQSNVRGFKCTVCLKKFPSQNDLKEHWSTHADSYHYKCKICDKKFLDEMNLSIHMGFHSIDRPYECKVCPKSFKDKWHLNVHMSVHSEDRPFMCTICGKRFRQSGNLHEHINTHSGLKPFECDTCQKRFPDKKQLRRHMKTHLDIKPFSCTMCEKRFKHKISLVNHIKEHNDEKQYECRVCQKRFVRKMTLSRHEKAHEV